MQAPYRVMKKVYVSPRNYYLETICEIKDFRRAQEKFREDDYRTDLLFVSKHLMCALFLIPYKAKKK